MDTDGPRSAFMSYSWEDKAHRSWVRKLASSLVRAGIDVKLDKWDVGRGDSLTQFMEKQIVDCDFVIVVCTPLYAARSQQRKGGVGYEQQIISGHIAAGVPRHKFIPVVRKGEFEPGTRCAIPPHFSGIYAIDMRKDAQYDQGVKSLLLAIHEAPQHPAPKLGARFRRRARHRKKQLGRLPIIELDGYRLISGVAMNQ